MFQNKFISLAQVVPGLVMFYSAESWSETQSFLILDFLNGGDLSLTQLGVENAFKELDYPL